MNLKRRNSEGEEVTGRRGSSLKHLQPELRHGGRGRRSMSGPLRCFSEEVDTPKCLQRPRTFGHVVYKWPIQPFHTFFHPASYTLLLLSTFLQRSHEKIFLNVTKYQLSGASAAQNWSKFKKGHLGTNQNLTCRRQRHVLKNDRLSLHPTRECEGKERKGKEGNWEKWHNVPSDPHGRCPGN